MSRKRSYLWLKIAGCFFCQGCAKFGSFMFIFFGSNFGSFFWGLGVLWLSFGSLLGPLILFWEALRAKKRRMSNSKTTFVKMQFFGSLKLLMVLLGSSCGLLGPIRRQNGPQNGAQKWSKRGPKQAPKNDLKNYPKSADFGSQNGLKMGFLGPPKAPYPEPFFYQKCQFRIGHSAIFDI